MSESEVIRSACCHRVPERSGGLGQVPDVSTAEVGVSCLVPRASGGPQ